MTPPKDRNARVPVAIAALLAVTAIAIVGGPRAAAATLVLFLPGAWLAFGLPLPGTPWLARLLLAATLTPLVLAAQLVLLRLSGVAFETASWIIAAINLPALVLAWRRAPTGPPPGAKVVAAFTAMLLVPVLGMLPQLLSPKGRAYSGHAWWHADVVYMVANGDIIVEEPELAGVRMAYAWVGHIYQAVTAQLAGTAPLSSFIWPNIVWLMVACGFVIAVVGELGGGRIAKLVSVIWLAFGVNVVGYAIYLGLRTRMGDALGPFAPPLRNIFAFGGDWRITPWLMKYYFFHQMLIGIGAFAGTMYLLVKQWDGGTVPRSAAFIVMLLVASVGLIYPVLFPAVAAAAGLGIVVRLADSFRLDRSKAIRDAVTLSSALVAATVITFAMLAFVTRDRASPTVSVAGTRAMFNHAILVAAVFLPFALSALYVTPRAWSMHGRAMATALAAGAASLLFYVGATIPGGGLEYKFIFTAAVALTPFAALASERVIELVARGAPMRFACVAALSLILALPLVHKLARDGWSRTYVPALSPGLSDYPALDMRRFDVRLRDGEPYGPLTDAIRDSTPRSTMIVTRDTAIHFPTLTRRRMFVAPGQTKKGYPGINVAMDQVLTDMRGYDAKFIAHRRSLVDALFSADVEGEREKALDAIARADRSMAIVLELPRDNAFADWLDSRWNARPLYRDAGHAAWLVEPGPTGRR